MSATNILNAIRLAAATLCVSACQSDSFRINGTAPELSDGDTLILALAKEKGLMIETTDIDTTTVKGHRFEFNGKTDSTRFAFVYSLKDRNNYVELFVEPGTTDVVLSDYIFTTRTGGTKTNNALQRMLDETKPIGLRIDSIATQLYFCTHTMEKRQMLTDLYFELRNMLGSKLAEHATLNIDNELAPHIILYYSDIELITPEQCAALIDALPEDVRKRPEIDKLRKRLAPH